MPRIFIIGSADGLGQMAAGPACRPMRSIPVPSRMGGSGRPATWKPHRKCRSGSPLAAIFPRRVTGEYFFHMKQRKPGAAARDAALQERSIDACERFSGIRLPA